MKRGQPQRGEQKATNLGVSISGEVKDELERVAQQQGWTKSYLTEQILRNYLELPTEYSWSDLQLAKLGILE